MQSTDDITKAQASMRESGPWCVDGCRGYFWLVKRWMTFASFLRDSLYALIDSVGNVRANGWRLGSEISILPRRLGIVHLRRGKHPIFPHFCSQRL
jgi:hypothetical protein